jgi:hypothetical protein
MVGSSGTDIAVGDILRQNWHVWLRVYAIRDNVITVRAILHNRHVLDLQRPVVRYTGWFVHFLGAVIWKIMEIREWLEEREAQ